MTGVSDVAEKTEIPQVDAGCQDAADAPMGAEERAGMLRGYAVLARACAAVLVNEPSDKVIADIDRVARTLDDESFANIVADDTLRQRYYDRFFVSSTPYFVPLTESAVVKRWTSEGRLHYGALDSARCDHVQRCYKTVGFDCRAIEGYAPAIQNLHPDSMACELVFLAGLAEVATHGEVSAPAAERLLVEFARLHARWFADAATCLTATDNDLYARTVAFAAENTAQLTDALADTVA